MKSATARTAMHAAAAVPVGAGDSIATRIQLLKIGRNELRDGRGAFVLVDQDHARRVVEATRRHAGGAAIPIDYDHQSVFAARDGVGGQAPAAGWIDPAGLEVTAEGIFAEVEWTPLGAERLAAREYRYISPVVLRDEASHQVIRLVNAGLTNSPAIPKLMAVASTQETMMDMTAISAALGLPETATVEDIVAAIAAMKEAMVPAATADEMVTAAVAPLASQLEIAAASIKDLTGRLETFQAAEREALVAAACEAGKVSPAQKGFWLERAKADFAGTRAFLDAAPVILPPGELVTAAVRPGNGSALSEDEAKVVKQLGISPEQYLKTKGA